MNRPSTPKPAPAGLTRQQILILGLVAFLGILALSLAGMLAFSSRPAPASPPPTLTALSVQASGPESQSSQASPVAAGQLPAALPAGCEQPGQAVTQAKVTRLIDPGTFEVQVDGASQRVTYAGIDLAQDTAGAVNAAGIAPGQVLTLVQDVTDRDTNGRLVRYVIAGERFINLHLVRQGQAQVSAGSPDRACTTLFVQAQQQARAERLGIWKATPVPTRTFVPFVTLDTAGQPPCECSKRPVCEDFKTHAEAQACYNACNDYNSKLDDDRDGIACENLP